ncbi:MAG: hypothetical protein E4H40_07700 [Candidatus Brocadiia bacterium]|nr:MAG: hypothetical protein E4H40_07700 [Candidatus Brocadiia bacterium]
MKDIDANIPLMMEPFGAESQYINVFVDDAGITCIEAGFKRSSLAALGDFGPGKITVYGKLANGHCFAGVDSIRVIDRRVEKLGELSSRWLEQNCRPPGWCGGSDLNADGRVDFIDFALLDELFVEIRVE